MDALITALNESGLPPIAILMLTAVATWGWFERKERIKNQETINTMTGQLFAATDALGKATELLRETR